MRQHPDEILLLAWLDGEAAEAQAEEVRAHCASCSSCARIVAEMESVRARVATARPDPPRPVWPGLSRRLGAKGRRRLGPAFALATAGAALAGLAVGLWLGSTSPGSPVRADAGPGALSSLWAGSSSSSLLDVYARAASAESEEP